MVPRPCGRGRVGLECVFLEQFGEFVGVYLLVIVVAVYIADVEKVLSGSVGVPVTVILTTVFKVADDVVFCCTEVGLS